MMGKCVEIGVAELYLPPYITYKRPICDRFAVLFSVPITWTCAGILTWSGAYNKSTETFNPCRTDSSGLINGAPWIYVPYPFQWGTPTFDAGDVMVMIFASFVSSIEVSSLSKLSVHHFIPEFMSKAFHVQSTGSFLATARYRSATPVPPSILSRGIGWLGLGSFLGGLCGSVTGFSASMQNVVIYSENCGALAFTRVGSRHVIQISAAFMIFFSVFGKFGAIFASIPWPVAAALYCIFFGCVSSAGLCYLQFCNLNSFRTKFILGLSFLLGLSIPQFFREHWVTSNHSPLHTHSRWFDNMVSVVLMSHASVAVMIAMILDCTLGRENNENGKDWWEKFAMYGKDVRTDEFYKLPWKLNKFFPAF
ncbi:putative nucleobase-ascorbate transporter 10 [Tanacetum coccineum]